MNKEKNISIKKKAAAISLAVGILMFIGKVSAYYITGSAAILSDAIESVIHIAATSFMYYSIIVSVRPANVNYPYGFGKIEYFSSATEGFLIIMAAISIIVYAVYDIINGSHVEDLDIGIILITSAAIINLLLGLYLIREGKKTNSIILVADGKHVLTDSYTSIGVTIGIILVKFTGYVIIDPVIAIIVGLNILITGKGLIVDSINGLLNRTESNYIDKIAEKMKQLKESNDNLIDIHLLRYWRSGTYYFVDFHCAVPKFFTIEETHNCESVFLKILQEVFETEEVDIKIHWDPCTYIFCSYCQVKNCEFRTEPVKYQIEFNSDRITDRPFYNFLPTHK